MIEKYSISKTKSKVKSFTTEGEKAITRAFMFKKTKDGDIGIAFTLLYFSASNEQLDECVRSWGDKYVYRRTYTIKLNTLYDTLINLGLQENRDKVNERK